jgi:hypothetical protein
MSWSIEIPHAAAPPPLAELLDAVNLADLRPLAFSDAAREWPAKPLQLYRNLISCRAVELIYEAGVIRVTLRSMSALEDCQLAVALARAAARLVGAVTVRPEACNEIAPDELEEFAATDWVRGQQESGARMTEFLVGERGTMALPGAIRPWHVGTRVLGELRALSSDCPLHERMIQRMRHIQWIDQLQGYTAAAQFLTSDPNPGKRITLAIWQPTVRLLMPEAKHVVLDANGGQSEIVILPHQRFVELAGDRLTWLDECQTLVEPILETDVPSLMRRAKVFDIKESLKNERPR